MPPQALIRVRLSGRDARSETGQVDPIRLLEMFNDIASELAIREFGDEGVLRGYSAFDVLGPLRVGDYIEARGRIADTGRKTLTVEFVAHKVIRAARTVENPMGGAVVDPPRLLGRATGVWLVPERVAAMAEDAVGAEAGVAEEGAPAQQAVEGETPEETAPLSWGGHRPADAPREKRRPGSTVRMRPDEVEQERPAERDVEEERYWRDRPDDRRGAPRGGGSGRGGSRSYSDRPRDDRGRDDRGRGGGRPYGERSRDDRGRDDRGRDDRGRGGGRPYNDRGRDDRGRSGGGRPYGERSRDDRGRDDRGRGGGRPYGERSRDDRGGGGRSGGSRSYDDRRRDDRPRDDRPREDRPPRHKDGDDQE